MHGDKGLMGNFSVCVCVCVYIYNVCMCKYYYRVLLLFIELLFSTKLNGSLYLVS